MAWPNRPEVALIQRRDLDNPEPLSQSDHRRIRRSERQVVVLRDELRHPGEVLRLQCHRFEVTTSNRPQERRLNTRTNSLLKQIADISHHRGRDQQPPNRETQTGEQVVTSAVVSVRALPRPRSAGPSHTGLRAGRAEAPGKDLVNTLREIRTAVLVDPHAEERRRPRAFAGHSKNPAPDVREHPCDLVIRQRIDELVQLVAISGHDTESEARTHNLPVQTRRLQRPHSAPLTQSTAHPGSSSRAAQQSRLRHESRRLDDLVRAACSVL